MTLISYNVTGRVINWKKLEKEIRESGAVVDFIGTPMSAGVLSVLGLALQDQAALDAIVRDHVAVTLDEGKAARVKVLGDEISAFILSRYSGLQQISLLMLMAEGNNRALATQRAEVQKGIDWIKDCLRQFFMARTAVLSATTIADAEAVELDLVGVAATDPLLDLEAVINIGGG